MNSFKMPLTLASLILLLGCFAYWDELKTADEKQKKITANRVFPDLEPETLLSVNLENQKSGSIKLERGNKGEWKIVNPISARVNEEFVSTFMKTVSTLKFDRRIEGVKNYEPFGLNDSRQNLILEGEGGFSARIEVGNMTPVGQGVYLKLEGDAAVYIVNQSLSLSLSKKLIEFRKRTFDIPRWSELAQLRLHGSELDLIFTQDNGEWALLNDSGVSLDTQSIRTIFNVFSKTEIRKFVDSPSASLKKALDPKRNGTSYLGEFAWQSHQGVSSSISFYENNEQIYASIEGSDGLLIVGENIKEEFGKTRWDFEDKRIVTYDSNDVQSLTIDSVTYVKSSDGQWAEEGKLEDVKEFPRLFLVDLEYSRATDILPELKGLKNILHKVQVKLGENINLTLELWEHPSDPGVIVIKKMHDQRFYVSERSLLENVSAKISKTEFDKSRG